MSTRPKGAATREPISVGEPRLIASSSAPADERPLNRRSLIVRVFLLALAVAVLVSIGGGVVARSLAESEAVRDAAVRTDDIAQDTITPVLENGLADQDPAAVQALDQRVRSSLEGRDIARVKVWAADGTIVYSDQPLLIGQKFTIDEDERQALQSGRTQAEISDLDEPENRYEQGDGPLLEVYRSVHTPDGTPLLFEVYYRYGDVLSSAERIWLGFVVVIPVSLLLLLAAMLPLMIGLVRRVERARSEREESLRRALDASDAERRRLAAALHDGSVQDLIGASYRVEAAADRAHGTDAQQALESADVALHQSIDSLRGSLLDLYPVALTEAGLATALADHVAAVRSRDAIIRLDVDDDLPLTDAGQAVVFRVIRETLANAVKYGDGSAIVVEVRRHQSDVVATVEDHGPGFDVAQAMSQPPTGHFGLRLLQDAVSESRVDAKLFVESRPGSGTRWRLIVSGLKPAR